jgi:hypothetical protein
MHKIQAGFSSRILAVVERASKAANSDMARGLQITLSAAARVPAFLLRGERWSESRTLIGEQRSGTRRDKSPGDGRNARIGIAPPWAAPILRLGTYLKRSGGLSDEILI